MRSAKRGWRDAHVLSAVGQGASCGTDRAAFDCQATGRVTLNGRTLCRRATFERLVREGALVRHPVGELAGFWVRPGVVQRAAAAAIARLMHKGLREVGR